MWANNYGKGNACDGRSEALVGTLQGVAEEGNERHVMAQLTSSFPGLASLAPHLATTPACTLLGYSAHVCTHKATVQYVCAHRHMHTQYTRTHPPTQARMHGHMHTHTCTTHMHTTRMHPHTHAHTHPASDFGHAVLELRVVSTSTAGCCRGDHTTPHSIQQQHSTDRQVVHIGQLKYRIAGNFGGKIFWRIAEKKSFGGIYFGG